MKKPITFAALFLVLFAGIFVVFKFYPYVFSKTINGKILKVERVHQGDLLVDTQLSGGAAPQGPSGKGGSAVGLIFSFAVSIRDEKGEIHTASSEDRQWAVAEPGLCVEAKFFPYPFWELDRAGTYYGARLIRLYECTSGANAAPKPQTGTGSN